MNDTFEVLTYKSPSVRERSIEIAQKDITTKEFQDFLNKLIKTMEVEDGVGIASPQIGINKRVVIVTLGRQVMALINPEITKFSDTLIETEEGCLSVPKVYGLVERSKKIHLKALDRHGRRFETDLKNFDSVVVQHELDHLDGILFVDKTHKITKGEYIPE
ncbi:peptide deformylase [Patescibacteria group bacterium]|nr:peptide deformylase [Patescibacteria group bacterium]